MSWTALSLGEVAALFAGAGALALWLYLRHPRPARLRVATLRFWASGRSGAATSRRWTLREPWAFAAQLLFLLALIGALANPRWGRASQGRSVALVVDAGAWTQMRAAGGGSWLDQARGEAAGWLARLPADDPVVLLRADSDGAPVVPLTTDRAALRAGLAGMPPSSAVADLPRALWQARAAVAGERRGLVVYIGPGLVEEKQARELEDFRATLGQTPEAGGLANGEPEFLVRRVGQPPLHDRGIAQIALKRRGDAADEWAALIQVKNYDEAPAGVTLSLSVAGHVFEQRALLLAPGATASVSDAFTSKAGGLLEAALTPGDDLAADDRATVVLPTSQPVSVAVVTSRASFAGKLRGVLEADPYVKAEFVRDTPPATADVVVYDGAAPAGGRANTISFAGPEAGSAARRVRLSHWNSDHPVTRWIESRDVTVRAAPDLRAAPGDAVLATSAGGDAEPLIVAREAGGQRTVTAYFDPLDSNFTQEPAFPLLMAAAVEWMTRPVGEQAGSLEAGPVDLPEPVARIAGPSGRDTLFASDGAKVHFFAGESGLYRVSSAGRTLSVPVNVPALPTLAWTPTAAEAAPLAPQPAAVEPLELWRWLVAAAIAALWLEWWFFYFRGVKREAGVAAGEGKIFMADEVRAESGETANAAGKASVKAR